MGFEQYPEGDVQIPGNFLGRPVGGVSPPCEAPAQGGGLVADLERA
jgi:hypothetical protein